MEDSTKLMPWDTWMLLRRLEGRLSLSYSSTIMKYVHSSANYLIHLLTVSQCAVSQVIEAALTPLVTQYFNVHFVKVHYEEIEFDNAGVPAILAYKNQGDLFANLTYIIDQIPDDTLFDTDALKNVLQKHNVL